MRQETRIVQIDSSAAFDGVNHLGILFKLCSVLSVLIQFLKCSRSQFAVVDSCWNKLVNMVSGVNRGSDFFHGAFIHTGEHTLRLC